MLTPVKSLYVHLGIVISKCVYYIIIHNIHKNIMCIKMKIEFLYQFPYHLIVGQPHRKQEGRCNQEVDWPAEGRIAMAIG